MRSRDIGRRASETATCKVGTVSLTADNQVFLRCTAHPTTRRASVALDFFIGNLVNGNYSDCPASGLRSRQLLFY